MSDDILVEDTADEAMAMRVRAALGSITVPWDRIDCDPALADTAAFCDHYGYRLDESANAIVISSKAEPKQFCVAVVLATTRVDVNKTVRKKLGARRASFATAEETIALTGMQIGGVTIFGLPDKLPIYVDDRIMLRDRIIVGGGSRDFKVFVSPRVFHELPNAEIVAGLALTSPS